MATVYAVEGAADWRASNLDDGLDTSGKLVLVPVTYTTLATTADDVIKGQLMPKGTKLVPKLSFITLDGAVAATSNIVDMGTPTDDDIVASAVAANAAGQFDADGVSVYELTVDEVLQLTLDITGAITAGTVIQGWFACILP